MGARELVSSNRAASDGKHRHAGGDEKREVGDYETKSKDTARRRSHSRNDATRSNALRPACTNVGVEPHHYSRSINRQHRSGNLPRIHQIISASAHADGAPQLSKESA